MKAKLSLVIFLLHFLYGEGLYGQHNDTLRLTLKDALSSALSENAEIQIAILDIQRAASNLRAVNGAFLPQISIDGTYTRNILRPVFFLPATNGFPGAEEGGTVIEAGFDNSFMATAQATLPIFNRQLFANSRAARTSVNLNEKGLAINKNEISTQVKRGYYEALLAWQSLQVLNQSLENAIQNYENIRNQFTQELVPEYDVIRAEVQVENIRPDVYRAENNFETAISNIKLLANIPDDIPVALVETLEELFESFNAMPIPAPNVENNPNLQQLDVQLTLREQQVTVQQAAWFPTLSAFGNYAYQSQANHFNFEDYFWVNTSAVGIQLSIPVFQGLVRPRQIEQARIDLKQTEINHEYLARSLTLQAKDARNRIETARKSLTAQERNISQAQRGFQIAQVSYNSGVITLVEVNDAELALTQARLNYIQVIYDYLIALADYEQITGREYGN